MHTQRLRLFGNVSIQTRMLLIIVPLIVVPMLILAIVGFLAASGAPSAAGVTVALTLEDGPGATSPKLPIISAGKASS